MEADLSLYDPNDFPREYPTPAEPVVPSVDFTVADVLAWARTKPADEEYDYCSNGSCAIAQFVRETGRSANPYVAGNGWGSGGYDSNGCLPNRFDDRLRDAANDSDETFGGLVERLEGLDK
jgi:hypothetical protein